LSLVRILCYTKKFVAAEEEVERLGDPAAAFHLARQYESQEKIADAIRYYAQVLQTDSSFLAVLPGL
jgi:intraflagellar transport protein 140